MFGELGGKGTKQHMLFDGTQVTFRMTAQEQANLRAYTQDVAAVIGAAGNRLRLDIALNWLADADFTIGSPATTLGPDNLSPAELGHRTQRTKS